MPCRAASWGSTTRRLWPLNATLPCCGWYAVDDVEHRGLARAVRSDYGADFVRADIEGNALERNHSAEGERDLVDLEDGRADLPARVHAAPRGGPDLTPLASPRRHCRSSPP